MKMTGLILAGGKSGRMGTNKAILEINGRTNIEHTIEELSKAADEIIIVANKTEDYQFLGLEIISDEYTGLGPLAGLHAGLKAARTDLAFAVACDMPFLKGDIMKEMAGYLSSHQAVVPKMNGRPQPLVAGYQKASLPALEKCLENGKLRMREFMEEINIKWLEKENFSCSSYTVGELERMFFNMNHPRQYEQALHMASVKEGSLSRN